MKEFRMQNAEYGPRTTEHGPRYNMLIIPVCVLCSVLFALLLSGCSKKDQMFKGKSRILMDTYCTITVVSDSREKAREAIDAGYAEIKKIELLLNYFSDTSEISAVNGSAGVGPIRVSADTLDILQKTVGISAATGGAFDPTLAPVIKLWRFPKDASESAVPSGKAVRDGLRLVDYKKIMIDAERLKVYLKDKGMELDLGGIAKGYGADKAVEAIRARGIRAALVAIAGDIRGYGVTPLGQGWKVGIQNPRPASGSDRPWEDIFTVLHLEDRAISTSGDYQRFFMRDGRRYHHILDPDTGFPAESGLISVSVIAPEGYLSDSLSTAVFVMGPDRGMKLLETMGLDGILVRADKSVLLTGNLKGKIEILNSEYRLAE